MKIVLNKLIILICVTIYTAPLVAQETLEDNPCFEDAEKLCKGKSIKNGQMGKCLDRNYKKLGPECLKKITHAKLDIKIEHGSVRTICKTDVQKYCPSKGKLEKTPVEYAACLAHNKKNLSRSCRKIFKK